MGSGRQPQPSVEPLTARTRQLVDALQVSSETESDVHPEDDQLHAESAPHAPVEPYHAGSKLSLIEGNLQVPENGVFNHPLVDAPRNEMPGRSQRSAQEAGGHRLPHDFSSDDDGVPPGGSGGDEERREAGGSEEKEVISPCSWPPLRELPMWYFKRLTGFDQSLDVYGFYPSWDQLVVFIFTSLTLTVLGLINQYGFSRLGNGSISGFIPAFGASCTVVYAVPKASISQPRNVVIAHTTAAIIGVALAHAFRSIDNELFGQHCAGALGVGLHLVLMMLTNTMHPPASATVISAATSHVNAYYRDEGFLFCLTPVLFGSVVIVVMAWLLNNLFESSGPYPQYW